MTAIEKEQIFVELRKYHLEEFPEKFANADMTDLFEEFKELEETIITMLLGLVNGKTGYVDYEADLENFKNKAAISKETDKAEKANRELFISKADLLSHVLKTADRATFMIKVPRNGPRQVGKAVTTKVTRS